MAATWKERLNDQIDEPLGREIDVFEAQIELRWQGKLEERLFSESRLRRGVYGQRYDNGLRHDGQRTQRLGFPERPTKGANTVWDAPGMQRIKIPLGRLTAEQMDVIADVAEEYSDGIAHVTTRQDLQLHYVHIDDTPDLMRRLAAVGVTTREACGNVVRNVTACPLSGVCQDEVFDVTPYAHACAYFMLGHPDAQDFGRKFKIAFSGCRHGSCALARIHDLGAIATERDGQRGFEVHLGGGLGAVPQQAKLLDEFVPEAEMLPLVQAIGRVFARLGEKKNRQRARLKFLVSSLGIGELARLVREERKVLRDDRRWTDYLENLQALDDDPRSAFPQDERTWPTSDQTDQSDPTDRSDPYRDRQGAAGDPAAREPAAEGFDAWRASNVVRQRQPGYVTATVRLPLGDIAAGPLRALAEIARDLTGDTVRTTAEQNIVLRWVPEADLPELHRRLSRAGLAAPAASTIVDVTSCPGTQTCKLGISSSRGVALAIGERLEAKPLPDAVRPLRVKVSGCFNACGQHHVADIGLLGVSRSVEGRRVPHFQIVLGGDAKDNVASFGLATAAVPSKNVPAAIERLTDLFAKERHEGESFAAFVQRAGKNAVRHRLEDLLRVPSYEQEPSYYSDWGDPREYTITDMGEGECAGELVTATKFGLAAAEVAAYEAQTLFERGELGLAAGRAHEAMLLAAQALLRADSSEVSEVPEEIVREFRTRLLDTGVFQDPHVGDKFAQYLLRPNGAGSESFAREKAQERLEETMLFIEAAHACYHRISAQKAREQ